MDAGLDEEIEEEEEEDDDDGMMMDVSPRVLVLTVDGAEKDGLPADLAEMIPSDSVVSLTDYLHDKSSELQQLYVSPESFAALALDQATGKKNQFDVFPPHKSFKWIRQMRDSGRVRLHKGKIHISPHDRSRGRVESSNFGMIRITGYENLNRAIDGDIVVVQILDSEESSGEPVRGGSSRRVIPGRVVRIEIRCKTTFCGSIEEELRPDQRHDDVTTRVRFIPAIPRYPPMLIRTRQIRSIRGMRIMVRLDVWERDSKMPTAHYVRTLGPIGDIETESIVVLEEHDVAYSPFSPAVLSCLPSQDWCISAEDIQKRLDLRNEVVFSIDPPGCTDIDDALHVKSLPSGDIEIGVHIADVSHFLKVGMAMDSEGRNRSTSVYLVQRRINMLPKLLTEILCSIREGEDKLTFSVIWEFDRDSLEIKSTKYAKTVVHSRGALTYDMAASIIADQTQRGTRAVSLRLLQRVANHLRVRRFAGGALLLASSEVKFGLDSEKHIRPVEIALYKTNDTHHLVEEFMLLANVAVAKKIYEVFPRTAVLRRHPRPVLEKFNDLQRALGQRFDSQGSVLDLTSSASLSRTLDSVGKRFSELDRLVRMMATRCMQQAVYFISGDVPEKDHWHYGLAIPIYTHFTSPIRRYADVLVHRQLAVAIGWDPPNPSLNSEEFMRQTCEHMNHRSRMAQYAQRASVNLYTLVFFRDRVITAVGRIVRITDSGIVVHVPQYGFESYIRLPDTFVRDPDRNILQDRASPVRYWIFQKLDVRLSIRKERNYRFELVIEILGRENGNLGALQTDGEGDVQMEVEDAETSSRKRKRVDGGVHETPTPKRRKVEVSKGTE